MVIPWVPVSCVCPCAGEVIPSGCCCGRDYYDVTFHGFAPNRTGTYRVQRQYDLEPQVAGGAATACTSVGVSFVCEIYLWGNPGDFFGDPATDYVMLTRIDNRVRVVSESAAGGFNDQYLRECQYPNPDPTTGYCVPCAEELPPVPSTIEDCEVSTHNPYGAFPPPEECCDYCCRICDTPLHCHHVDGGDGNYARIV